MLYSDLKFVSHSVENSRIHQRLQLILLHTPVLMEVDKNISRSRSDLVLLQLEWNLSEFSRCFRDVHVRLAKDIAEVVAFEIP